MKYQIWSCTLRVVWIFLFEALSLVSNVPKRMLAPPADLIMPEEFTVVIRCSVWSSRGCPSRVSQPETISSGSVFACFSCRPGKSHHHSWTRTVWTLTPFCLLYLTAVCFTLEGQWSSDIKLMLNRCGLGAESLLGRRRIFFFPPPFILRDADHRPGQISWICSQTRVSTDSSHTQF